MMMFLISNKYPCFIKEVQQILLQDHKIIIHYCQIKLIIKEERNNERACEAFSPLSPSRRYGRWPFQTSQVFFCSQ